MIQANDIEITDDDLLAVYDACSSMSEQFVTKAQFVRDINAKWDAKWTECFQHWYGRATENAILSKKRTALLNAVCCMAETVDD